MERLSRVYEQTKLEKKQDVGKGMKQLKDCV